MTAAKALQQRTGIVWLRQDLRLSDNPALFEACSSCESIVIAFIDDPVKSGVSRLGAASRVWLHHSLASLRDSLEAQGLSLSIMRGNAAELLPKLISDVGATDLFWNRCYDPETIRRDAKIKEALSGQCRVQSYNGLLLREPWELSKPDGTPYRVFTPFWKKLLTCLPENKPLPRPQKFPRSAHLAIKAGLLSLDELELMPPLDWGEGMMEHWSVGEGAASGRLKQFVRDAIDEYDMGRDIPSVDGTSKLSPHLHFGEISARQVLWQIKKSCPNALIKDSSTEKFAREVGWREFAYHLLYHFPKTVKKPLNAKFDTFPWERLDRRVLQRWQTGQTGIPIVDAGMRQLWQTGWMHNRVRMIVGSFLVKNLLLHWQHGEAWFRDTLVDADLASNVMGWQWVAGSGADAAPYFRVFNPVLQGEKFDKEGGYVRHWVPELAELEVKFVHKPWEAPASLRPSAYPAPMVSLSETRQRALMRYQQMKDEG